MKSPRRKIFPKAERKQETSKRRLNLNDSEQADRYLSLNGKDTGFMHFIGADWRSMNLAEELKGAKTIALGGHEHPDGDCIGACMGTCLYLKKLLPEARIDVFLEDFSDAIREYMPGTEQIRSDFQTNIEQYDVFIAFDTTADRLGEAKPFFDRAAKKINIDHHVTNSGDGDVNEVDPKASSTCEMVYRLLDHSLLDEPIARALYIGMMTDTGVFKYSNTTKETMTAAGDLISYGFDFTSIINGIFYEKTYWQTQILGRALLESIRFMDGQCVVSVIERKTMDFYQVTSKDLEGIASQLKLIKGVKCAIFMYQVAPLTYKVSLRSDGSVDVSAVAKFYGGGGHMRAAGFTTSAPYHDIINNLSKSIDMQLKKA